MSEQKFENYGGKPLGSFKRRLVFSLAAGLAVFAVLSIYADVEQVGHALAQFGWGYVPLILLLTISNYLLRFCKWHFYLRSIGIAIGCRDSMVIFFSGLTMSVTPAKLGEVFKSYLLKRLNGTEVSRSVPVVLAERATDVLSLIVLAAISFSALEYGLEVLIAVLAVLLIPIVLLQSRRICIRLLEALKSLPLLARLSDSLITAYESAYALFRLRILLVALSISVISWGFECLAMYYVLLGFGVEASLPLSTFVFSFSSLAGAISMIPGGLAVAEGSFAGLLILSGFAREIAAGATVLIRFCTLWFGVMLGAVTLLLFRNRFA